MPTYEEKVQSLLERFPSNPQYDEYSPTAQLYAHVRQSVDDTAKLYRQVETNRVGPPSPGEDLYTTLLSTDTLRLYDMLPDLTKEAITVLNSQSPDIHFTRMVFQDSVIMLLRAERHYTRNNNG